MINRLIRPLVPYIPENNRLERIWLLAKADFIARFYGSALGVFWAFLNPLFQVTLYALVFTVLFRINIPNYTLYLFSGIIAWMFFSETTRSAMRVFRAKRYLIENVLIPKIDLFLASLSCAGMAFGVNFVMYIFVSLLFPVEYSGVVLYTIPLLVILTLISLSIGMALGVGALYYRDIEHLWDILLMAGWWITPVIYSREQMGNIPYLTYLNPLAGVFLNLRDTLIYNTAPDLYLMAYDALYALLLWTVSYLLFVRLSRRAAELI